MCLLLMEQLQKDLPINHILHDYSMNHLLYSKIQYQLDFLISVATVRGLIKSQEAGVNIHLTSAPDFFNNRIRDVIL
jgi:hypothetical protein